MKLNKKGKGSVHVASTHKFDSIAMGICADDVNCTRSVVQARLVHISTARLTLWLDCIDTSETGNSYCLQGLMVRSFNRASYLTTQKTGFIASIKEDIVNCVSEAPNGAPNCVQALLWVCRQP